MALGLATPAAATAKEQPDRYDIDYMYRFAQCVVGYTRSGAEKALGEGYDDATYSEALTRLAKGHDRCLGTRMKISGILLAGSLAEVLLRNDLKQDQLTGVLKPSDPALLARNSLEYTALCMVLSHPAQTSELLFSAPESKEADALIMDYAQGLPACVADGQQLRVSKLGLRAIIALAAYRIAKQNESKA
ncbi:MAG: hypothetical protein IE933_02270 [Sphingomonadales bacterium]|nr:hypothetical protein [Sphingomonadales bacterium]MBD3772239.1 hypothetical protein [Paracoccaceae bacterium]